MQKYERERKQLAEVLADAYESHRNLFYVARGRQPSYRRDGSELKQAEICVSKCAGTGVNPLQALSYTLFRQIKFNRSEFLLLRELPNLSALNADKLRRETRQSVAANIRSSLARATTVRQEARVMYGDPLKDHHLYEMLRTTIDEVVVLCGLLDGGATDAEKRAALRRYLMCPDVYETMVPKFVTAEMKQHPKFED